MENFQGRTSARTWH